MSTQKQRDKLHCEANKQSLFTTTTSRRDSCSPWMSSLNVQYLSRYRCSSWNALWLPKSSNWINVCSPNLIQQCEIWLSVMQTTNETLYYVHLWNINCFLYKAAFTLMYWSITQCQWHTVAYFFTTACMNSSTNFSYSTPLTRFWRSPVYSGSSSSFCDIPAAKTLNKQT